MVNPFFIQFQNLAAPIFRSEWKKHPAAFFHAIAEVSVRYYLLWVKTTNCRQYFAAFTTHHAFWYLAFAKLSSIIDRDTRLIPQIDKWSCHMNKLEGEKPENIAEIHTDLTITPTFNRIHNILITLSSIIYR